ncbi:MAG: MBL fold metallo-hydrolase [Gemmatimonadota bacterium]|nr:MBL fold metallo-hydrolase [Gemmatimonadota bacterium]
MLLRRFYDDNLAQASYLVGCAATGEAIVVDPNLDTQQYIAAAAAEGLLVTHVSETHIHADFVSGSVSLARQTGARLLLSGEGGADWQYSASALEDATTLRAGDTFMVGNIRFDVLHTPGHSPEHLSFVMTDTRATSHPMGALTGDFIFVGDVGRPDLLERAARQTGTMEISARQLFKSLQKFRSLPDYLQLWPGHGAGSACGKALGAVPSSSLGYEKIANWAFAITDENEFARTVLAGQPESPLYFAMMKRINKEGSGRPLTGTLPPELPAADVDSIGAGRRTVLIDMRPAPAFAAGSVRGAISIPLNRSFARWVGEFAPYDRDIALIVADGDIALLSTAIRDLALIGLDRVTGYFSAKQVVANARASGTLERVPQLSATSLVDALESGDVAVLDVRSDAEFASGHLAGALNIPMRELEARSHEVPRERPVVVHCQSGARSAIAVSVLRARGFENVMNLTGGISEWRREQLPVELGADGVVA